MTRPSDWYPLAVFDPVSGDPARVASAGVEYARVAEQIEASAAELRVIAAQVGGGSDAVDEVAAKASRLADTIERAHGRYAAAGVALQEYAGGLAYAQELSLAAYTTAVTAVRAQDEALASIAWWRRLADGAQDPEARSRYERLADDAREDLHAGDVQLEQARTELRLAIAQRDSAVSAVCAAIRGAMDRDDLHDTIWQDLGGGAQEVGLALWNSVDEVATALSCAAVVLCWVPGVNGVVAAGATIAGVLLLARDSVNVATGNGSWADVGNSAIGVATFAVGRFAQQAIRLSVASARGGRALAQSGLVDDAVGAAGDAAEATVRGSGLPVPVVATGTRGRAISVLRSEELWHHMSPAAMARDTWSDLRGGVSLVRAPALYRPSAAGHVSRPVDDVASPVSEYASDVVKTWRENKIAGAFSAVGNEGAARAMSSPGGARGAQPYVLLSGSVQIVEVASVLAPFTASKPSLSSPTIQE